LIFYEKSDFNCCTKYTIKKLVEVPIPRNPATEYIFNIYDCFEAKKRSKNINNLNLFRAAVEGDLFVRTCLRHPTDNFEIFQENGEFFSKIGGCYISPFALSIFQKNTSILDGIMLDTTWRVMRLYVTSILMVILANVGIPVAFAFGPVEDSNLYETFFTTFMEVYNIDLSIYVLESDQGSALKSIASKYGNQHLACLRHFLVSLKQSKFSYQVGNLVKCRVLKDFITLKEIYEKEFSNIPSASKSQL
jgi:hypothetical protein